MVGMSMSVMSIEVSLLWSRRWQVMNNPLSFSSKSISSPGSSSCVLTQLLGNVTVSVPRPCLMTFLRMRRGKVLEYIKPFEIFIYS